MFKYRNKRNGVVAERHAPDEWLEASDGWERVDDVCDYIPTPEPADDDQHEGSND
jgi:hypothetical protein